MSCPLEPLTLEEREMLLDTAEGYMDSAEMCCLWAEDGNLTKSERGSDVTYGESESMIARVLIERAMAGMPS